MKNNKWNQERRHYCELCKTWMPPTKASIASHERSARHQENIKVMMEGGRRRGPNFAAANLSEYNRQQFQMVENAAKQKFNTVDMRGHFLDSGRVPPPPQVSDPIIKEPSWSSHFDEEGKVFYYNRLTNKSTYEKPKDFDGYDAAAQNPLLSAPSIFKATPLYTPEQKKEPGALGGWTDVAPEEQYFQAKKLAETEEEKKTKEEEQEKLKEEVLNVHRGVVPKPKPESVLPNLKLSKEAPPLPEDEQESEEEVEGKEEDGVDANQTLKKRTEKLREVVAKQTIEFVDKPVYREETAPTQESGQNAPEFKKRVLQKGKRKAPESAEPEAKKQRDRFYLIIPG